MSFTSSESERPLTQVKGPVLRPKYASAIFHHRNEANLKLASIFLRLLRVSPSGCVHTSGGAR
jgi:hypothetical protein